VRLARAPAAIALVVLLACGPSAPSASAPTADPAPPSSAAFDRLEEEILRDLAATDRRIAVRARITPSEEDLRRVTMAAVLREDPTLGVIAGSIDPFSFDARARGLEAIRAKVASLPSPAEPSATSERELLGRLVDAEVVRLEEERALPRSASSLVRAIVDTWQPPKSERERGDHDRLLARRLRELRETLAATDPGVALDVVRARELDDALDALERLAAPGFTQTTQELVRLRDALEAADSRPPAEARSDFRAVARSARAHLGVSSDADELSRRLAALAVELRARAEQAVGGAGIGRDELAERLEKHVFAAGPCHDAVPGSRVRSMAAPKEREPACHLRHLVARADDPTAHAVALAAMHDHVVVALWAVDVARGASTIAAAQGTHRLLAPVLPEVRARYERIAVARPVAAIGAGETARILMAGDPKARAAAWSALGDVPLDVAARALSR